MASINQPDKVAPPGWEPWGHYTIAVDFDGVIHSYTTPWAGAHIIPDPPIQGALPWLRIMLMKFRVVIHSTRCKLPEGIEAVKEYLTRNHLTCYVPERHEVIDTAQPGLGVLIEDLDFTAIKPAALIYLDDRAVRFTGSNFPTKDQIHRDLIPWNKRPMGVAARSQPDE